MKTISVLLPKDRLSLGKLSVCDEAGGVLYGPCEVDGKSDNAAAAQHGNPSRNPEEPFGDTPCGQYIGSIRYEPNTDANRRSFGQPDRTGRIPVIHLQPIEGDTQAWDRQQNENAAAGHHVDMGLAAHAGDLSGSGGLRVTHGCLRLKQSDRDPIVAQVAGLPSFPFSIQEE